MLGRTIGRGGGSTGYDVLQDYDPADVTAAATRVGELGAEIGLNPFDWDVGIANRKIMGDRQIGALRDPLAYHNRRIQAEKHLADAMAPQFQRIMQELNAAGLPPSQAKMIARESIKKKFEVDSAIIDELYPQTFMPSGLKRMDADAHKAVADAAPDA